MKPEELQDKLARFLSESGIPAMASWPERRREHYAEPIVLVSLERMKCSPAGMQDYLGQRESETTGQLLEVYGRKAELTFTLDVLADKGTSAQGLRRTAMRLTRLFQTQRPEPLTVVELNWNEISHDEKEGLLCLRCTLECTGIICTAGEEAGTFLDFTLRGVSET